MSKEIEKIFQTLNEYKGLTNDLRKIMDTSEEINTCTDLKSLEIIQKDFNDIILKKKREDL